MATVRVERRLSAILAADIVGYSRLMEAQVAVAEVLRSQPDFSTAVYMSKSVLLERAEIGTFSARDWSRPACRSDRETVGCGWLAKP